MEKVNVNNEIKITHPGKVLKKELDKRSITQKELSFKIGIGSKHISQVINCHRRISVDLALRLEKALNIESSYWNNIQIQYEDNKARLKNKNL